MRLQLVLLLSVSLTMIGCSADSGPEETNLPRTIESWQNDDSLETKLASRCKYIGYSLQPVKGFASAISRNSGNTQVKGWAGQRPGNAPATSITVSITTPPKNEEPTLETATRKFLDGVKKRRTNWTESPSTFGKIDNELFSKTSWTGTDTEHKVDLKGTMFVGLTQGKLVSIAIQDMANEPDDQYAAAQNSALTFEMNSPEVKERE